MKGLAIDSAITKLTISARNEDHTVSAVYNIGMKQSETLLPAIEYVLSKADLKTTDLEYLTLSEGPGSFTGLRLGFSALKAIEMATNAPLYGINTLDVYAENYLNLPFTVISCIDAKKDRFYAKAFNGKEMFFKDGDYTPEEIAAFLKDSKCSDKVIICGSDAELLAEQLKPLTAKTLLPQTFNINAGEILLNMAEKMIADKEEPMNDYDGPVYLRASEAEVKLNQ